MEKHAGFHLSFVRPVAKPLRLAFGNGLIAAYRLRLARAGIHNRNAVHQFIAVIDIGKKLHRAVNTFFVAVNKMLVLHQVRYYVLVAAVNLKIIVAGRKGPHNIVFLNKPCQQIKRLKFIVIGA